MDIQTLFQLGMKRELPQLLDFPAGPVLNLGAGKTQINGALNIDWPEWDAEQYEIQAPIWYINHIKGERPPGEGFADFYRRVPDESLSGIHAYHFLEHLRDPRRMLREMQRVLKPGGVINIIVPHYSGSMAHHDLDHKNTYALDTWANAFNTPYYDKDREGWKMRVHFNLLIGIVERNAAIMTQLVKES